MTSLWVLGTCCHGCDPNTGRTENYPVKLFTQCRSGRIRKLLPLKKHHIGDGGRVEPSHSQRVFFTLASDTESISGNVHLICWLALRKCPPPPPAQQVNSAIFHCFERISTERFRTTRVSTAVGHVVATISSAIHLRNEQTHAREGVAWKMTTSYR